MNKQLSTAQKWLKRLLWLVISLAGAASIGVIALVRGENISSLWLIVAGLCTFAIAYRFHSSWLLAKVLTIDDMRATPSVTKEDGKDYIPTNRWIAFGHHFAAIAGAGPLIGPVLASQFGYLPGALWILIGAVLGGAVHDTMILFFSVRHGGKSLAEMIREEINTFAGRVAMVSVLAILVIVVAGLSFVVVKALGHSPWGLFTIAMTIPIAVVMGVGMQWICPKRIGIISVLGAAALLFCVWFGGQLDQYPALKSLFTVQDKPMAFVIMGYGIAVSVLPMWLLITPRGYLSTIMKIGTIIMLAVAAFFIAPELKMPALTRFIDGTGPFLAGGIFPFCFITIACGAISGFHSLISSGTTPKILEREKDIRLAAYGSMLAEMMVSIMALVAACSLQPGIFLSINMKPSDDNIAALVAKADPALNKAELDHLKMRLAADDVAVRSTALGFAVTGEDMVQLAKDVGEETMVGRTGGAPTFAVGMAKMFAGIFTRPGMMALWYHFAIMFEALFILTTIDSGTRVGRVILQEFMGQAWKPLGPGSLASDLFASFLFVGAWGWFLYQGVVDPFGGINVIWPIFGVANQLLAVVALAFSATMLIKMKKLRYLWVPGLPLVWLLAVTLTAGWQKIFSSNVRIGFVSAAKDYAARITSGINPAKTTEWHSLMVNNYIDAVVTGIFMVLVVLVVLICLREWWQILSGRKSAVLHESPNVRLSAPSHRIRDGHMSDLNPLTEISD
ncbi:MAG TPA: carbon starvation CstA family protein [Pontiellaceae bacterium]|nr:carbon starvation CstA family protein [Pontiellaceae bacterium]